MTLKENSPGMVANRMKSGATGGERVGNNSYTPLSESGYCQWLYQRAFMNNKFEKGIQKYHTLGLGLLRFCTHLS